MKRTFSCTRNRFAGDERCLALLVGLSIALLTAYFGESASGGLHAIQRGFLEVMAPLQEGASRALKPARDLGRLDRRRVRREVREQGPEGAGRGAARAAGRGADGRARCRAAARRWSASTARRGFPDGYDPVAARVIGRSPTVWYSAITIDKGSDQGVRADQPVVSGDGLVGQGVGRRAGRGARDADHRSHERRVGAGRARRRQRAREGDGREPVRPDPRLRAEGPRRCARARPWSRRAGARRGSSRCSRAASRSARVTRVDSTSASCTSACTCSPFADLRELDVVEVLTAPARRRGAETRR